MRWKGARLPAHAGLGQDAALGTADEVHDGVADDALWIVGFNEFQSLGHVHTLEVDGVVELLDQVYFFFAEAAAEQAHAVHAFEHGGFATHQHVRRNVFHQLGAGGHEGVRTHLGKLVAHTAASQGYPVVNVGLSGQARVTHDDAVVAYRAVVGNVGVAHNEGVAAHTGNVFAAGGGTAVDGGALADVHAVANLHAGFLAFKLEVLGNGTYHGAGEHGAVLAHFDIGVDGGAVENAAAVTNLYVGVDEGEGAHFYIVSQFGLGAYTGEGMNLVHKQLFKQGADGLGCFCIDGMAGLESCDASVQVAAGQTEISQQVQQLVAAALVREMEDGVVHIAGIGNHQRVGQVSALDEVVLEHRLNFAVEAEGAAGSNLAGIIRLLVPMGLLDAQHRGVEIHGNMGRRGIGRLYLHPGARARVAHFDGEGEGDVLAGDPLVFQPIGLKSLYIGFCTAVEDGHFLVVQFNAGVVHAQAREGTHNVLDSHGLGLSTTDGGAAGGVGHVLGQGLYLRLTLQVYPVEPDAKAGRGRHDLHMGIRSCMQSLSFKEVRIF